MDISIPVNGWEAVSGIGAFALMGWNLYVNAKWKAVIDALGRNNDDIEKLRLKLEIVEKDYLSHADHKEFRSEMLALIEKMNLALTGAIDKLSARLERFVEKQHEG